MSQEKLVIVVEDDASQREAIASCLKSIGFVPHTAAGLREALFRLKNQKYALIILDLLLGKESGSDLIQIVRTRPDIPNSATPILVVSANLSKETLQSLSGKIQGAIVKPLDEAAFIAHVKRLVD